MTTSPRPTDSQETPIEVPPIKPHIVAVHCADDGLLATFIFEPPRGAVPSTSGGTGDKPPILMLHGNGGSHGSFWQIAPIFAARGHVVIVPDMRGQGISTRGSEPLTYELLADDARHVLNNVGVSDAVVLGYSDGGIEALLLARDYPQHIAGILCMGANLSPEGVLPMDEPMEDQEALLRTVARYFPAAKIHAELLSLMINEPQIDPASLAAISCPATIMAGEFDAIAPEETDRIAEAVPGARKVIVEGAGHGLMKDAPQTVIDELQRLVDTVMT